MVNYQQITKKNISHNPIYKQSNSDRPNPPWGSVTRPLCMKNPLLRTVQ
jgi:hypothetical protein